jgi:hypothetical protein
MAWRTPPVVSNVQDRTIAGPVDSRVPQTQRRLLAATRAALKAVADDVKTGLSETVGVGSTWVETDRSSVILELPPDTDEVGRQKWTPCVMFMPLCVAA